MNAMKSQTYCTHYLSPLGTLFLVSHQHSLAGVYFENHRHPILKEASWIESKSVFSDVLVQLTEYFEGSRTQFDLPLSSQGTEFQNLVWDSLKSIPFGQSTTYAAVANDLGRPKAVRAVGAAIGRNPWSIVVPCHRVLGGRGQLTGFTGGMQRKEWLLNHEAIDYLSPAPALAQDSFLQ